MKTSEDISPTDPRLTGCIVNLVDGRAWTSEAVGSNLTTQTNKGK